MFPLNKQPLDYILTIHMDNLNWYGRGRGLSASLEWHHYSTTGNCSYTAKKIFDNIVATYGFDNIKAFMDKFHIHKAA